MLLHVLTQKMGILTPQISTTVVPDSFSMSTQIISTSILLSLVQQDLFMTSILVYVTGPGLPPVLLLVIVSVD